MSEELFNLAKAAIKAMAEDGWLFHGVEGMDAVQQICYDAYLKLGLKDADLVLICEGVTFEKCANCNGSGLIDKNTRTAGKREPDACPECGGNIRKYDGTFGRACWNPWHDK